jgi:hypothetical protein
MTVEVEDRVWRNEATEDLILGPGQGNKASKFIKTLSSWKWSVRESDSHCPIILA